LVSVSAGVEFNQSPQLVIADVIGGLSLIFGVFLCLFLNYRKSEVLFARENLKISN